MGVGRIHALVVVVHCVNNLEPKPPVEPQRVLLSMQGACVCVCVCVCVWMGE